jgi:hypothetical protein
MRGGNGQWVVRPEAKLKASFLKASNRLRFDDWIGRALTSDVEPHAGKKDQEIRWSTPATLRDFRARLPYLVNGESTVRSSSHAGRLQLKAFAAVPAEKLLSSVVERRLALHILSEEAVGVPAALNETLAWIDAIGDLLKNAANACLSENVKGDKGVLGGRLKSALMERLDDDVTDFVSRLITTADDEEVIVADTFEARKNDLQTGLLSIASNLATEIYRNEFPARTMGSNLLGILKGEEVLGKGLRRLFHQLGKKQQRAA